MFSLIFHNKSNENVAFSVQYTRKSRNHNEKANTLIIYRLPDLKFFSKNTELGFKELRYILDQFSGGVEG